MAEEISKQGMLFGCWLIQRRSLSLGYITAVSPLTRVPGLTSTSFSTLQRLTSFSHQPAERTAEAHLAQCLVYDRPFNTSLYFQTQLFYAYTNL